MMGSGGAQYWYNVVLEERRQRRQYLPTLADLVDRLSIVQLKMIFIPENREAYSAEIGLILHDIDLILRDRPVSAEFIRASQVIMLANRYIWENESKAREGGSEQDHLLKLTHSINGVRNTAKNVISRWAGERVDLKVDCLADADNWRIWEAK